MIKFPENNLSPKNQEQRKRVDNNDDLKKKLFQEKILSELDSTELPTIQAITNFFPISQKNSKYSDMPYGEIGNVGEAGCGPLAVEYALRILKISTNFEEILNETVKKEYRGYIYDENGKIIDGCGTEYSLFSNIAREVQSLKDMIDSLKKGQPITILIENAIYHNDMKRKGNHFVTIIGIEANGNAIIMDGNLIVTEEREALVNKDFRKILQGVKLAWAWDHDLVLENLKWDSLVVRRNG